MRDMLPLYHAGLIAYLLATVLALESVSISGNVTAGVDTSVTFVPNPGFSKSTLFQVTLYNSVSNNYVCTLVPSVPITSPQFSVNIPPSVGPSGAYYLIGLPQINRSSLFGPDHSNVFFLSGATGEFSVFELNHHQFYSGATIPCESYDCVRQCAQADPPIWQYDPAYVRCMQACSGVELGNGQSGQSATPTTTTAVGAASLFTAATASGSVVSSVSAVAPPTATCNLALYQTPCGADCCPSNEYCMEWGLCADLIVVANLSFPIQIPDDSSQTSAVTSTVQVSPTQSSVTPTTSVSGITPSPSTAGGSPNARLNIFGYVSGLALAAFIRI